MEVFDDDFDEEDDAWRKGSKKDKDRKENPKKKQTKEEKESARAGFLSVRDMLTSMPQKRKRQDNGEIDDKKEDDLLGDLMQELHEEKKAKIVPTSSRFLESTQAKETLLETSRIKEAPFASSAKVIAKRKFQAFKVSEPAAVDIKLEPDDTPTTIEDGFDDDSFPPSFPDDDDILIQTATPKEQEIVTVKNEKEVEITANSDIVQEDTVDKGVSVPVSIRKELPKIAFNVNSIDNFQSYVKKEATLASSDSTEQVISLMITKNEEGQQVSTFVQIIT